MSRKSFIQLEGWIRNRNYGERNDFQNRDPNEKYSKVSGRKLRYFIVDDDTASRRMLEKIITEGGLGIVIGEAESGVSLFILS